MDSFLEENDINPYKFLGISKDDTLDKAKKKFVSKLKKIQASDDSLEFTIAVKCFEYISNNVKTLDKPKKKRKKQSVKHDDNRREDHGTDETKQKEIHTDTVEKEEESREVDNVKNEDIKCKNIFRDGKFNIKNFNAVFELEKSKVVDDSECHVMEHQSNSTLGSLNIHTYNGLIFGDEESSNSIDSRLYDFNDLENNLFNTDSLRYFDEYDKKKLSSVRTGAKKQNIKKKEDLTKEHKITHNVSNIRELNESMNNLVLQQFKNEADISRQKVLDNLHIYNKDTIDKFNRGELEDSSNCISQDGLRVPIGIRKY